MQALIGSWGHKPICVANCIQHKTTSSTLQPRTRKPLMKCPFLLANLTWNDILHILLTANVLTILRYILKVVLSKKRCEIDTLLLHTTNRQYHMAYLFMPFPLILDDLEGHSPNAGLIKCNSTNICATSAFPQLRWPTFLLKRRGFLAAMHKNTGSRWQAGQRMSLSVTHALTHTQTNGQCKNIMPPHTHIHRMGEAHIEKLFSFLKSLQTVLSNPQKKNFGR